MTRRSLMTAAATSAFARAGATGNPLTGARLYSDLTAYAALGEHRTATPVDHKTASWLARELGQCGIRAQQSAFPVNPHYTHQSCGIRLGANATVAAFPLWWPKATGRAGMSGPLVSVENPLAAAPGSLQGKVAFVKLPETVGASLYAKSPIHAMMQPLVGAGVSAVIGESWVATGEAMALNAMAGRDAWPVPFVMVGAGERERLAAAAAGSVRATVWIDGKYKSTAKAFEVVGQLDGGPRRIVVSTPYSGWHRCAGERGPGIALWLGLARWVAARPRNLAYTFVASSGHEIDGLGIRWFLEHLAPKAADVAAWLHLGAGIATYEYSTAGGKLEKKNVPSTQRRLFCAAKFEPILRQAFAGQPGLRPVVSRQPLGEMAEIARAGYSFFGFAGGSAFHHMPGDVPERICGPELLEPVAASLAQVLLELEKQAS